MIAWLHRWGAWVLFVAGGLVGWFIFRRRTNPIPEIKVELAAIRAETNAERLVLELGRERALQEIEQRYEEQKNELAEEQRAEAETLKSDPVALSRFLVRAGARRPK